MPTRVANRSFRADPGFRAKSGVRVLSIVLLLVASALLSSPSRAQMGSMRVVFTKAALIAGAGAGRGVLTYRGHDYPIRVSGLSLGIAAGVSRSRFFGRVAYLQDLQDFPGVYEAVGLGGALAGGVGGVQLKNAKGVIITLQSAKFGLEAAANRSKINITLE
jgi:hypothetical protein